MQQHFANSAPRSQPSPEYQVCRAIATLGRLAGIDVERGDGPEDIDGNLIQAAYECHFDDPQFLGGPGCFDNLGAPADVALLAGKARLITRGMLRYIERRALAATVREARAQVALVEYAFTSLQRTH